MSEEWFNNFKEGGKAKEKLLRVLEETGAPFENRVHRFFQDKGYRCHDGFYMHDGVSRQIDIIARRQVQLNTKNELNVFLNIIFVGDCKYTYQNLSYFLFKPNVQKLPNLLIGMPVLTNGERMSYSIHEGGMSTPDFNKIWGDVIIADKIVQIETANFFKKDEEEKFGINKQRGEEKEKKYKSLYEYCNQQIMPALKYYYLNNRKYVSIDYNAIENQIGALLENRADYIGGSFPIFLIVPVIVTNKNIYDVIFENNGEIKDVEETGYCVYLHAPNEHEKFKQVLWNRWEQPIFIIDFNKIDSFFKCFEMGIEKIKNEIEININKNPVRIVHDMIKFKEEEKVLDRQKYGEVD